MHGKFGVVTGGTIRKNEINRLRSRNNRFIIIKNICKNFDRNDILLMQTTDLPYSLNKKRRWEILDNMPMDNVFDNATYCNKVICELSKLFEYQQTKRNMNLGLIFNLLEGKCSKNCFRYYVTDVAVLSRNSCEKKDKKFINLNSIRDNIEKNKINTQNKNKKSRNKKSKNWHTLNDDIELAYTIYFPNPLTSQNSKNGANRKRYLKKRQRKKRAKINFVNHEDYDFYYSYDDYDDEEKTEEDEKLDESYGSLERFRDLMDRLDDEEWWENREDTYNTWRDSSHNERHSIDLYSPPDRIDFSESDSSPASIKYLPKENFNVSSSDESVTTATPISMAFKDMWKFFCSSPNKKFRRTSSLN